MCVPYHRSQYNATFAKGNGETPQSQLQHYQHLQGRSITCLRDVRAVRASTAIFHHSLLHCFRKSFKAVALE